MRTLQRNAIPARTLPAQAGYRPLDGAAQTVATPPGLHYTTGVVERASAADATLPRVVQRVTRKRQRSENFYADYSDEDELETTAAPTTHDYIGMVSWNVQHFSNHDLEEVAEELQKQLDAFDVDEWRAFFKKFSSFRKDLRKDLGKVKYARGAFKGLQNVDSRLSSIDIGLNAYDTFLETFDVEAFAKQIEVLKNRTWKDEITQSDNDQSERVALLEIVGKFKYVVEQIDTVRNGLRNVAAILGNATIFKRMDKDLAKSARKLAVKLRKVQGNIVNKSTLETFRKALHSHNIAVHVDEMFAQNQDWLDVIILQEINKPDLLKDNEGYDMSVGPHMKSSGKNGQNEYYPLLIRKDSGVTVEKEYLVTTDGTLKKVTDDELYKWQKKNSVYRPIMAYLVSKKTESGTQRYLIGVVHTTPEVDGGFAEFNRRSIYEEVVEGLTALKQWAKDRKLPLIVGGDYYLSAEAVVNDPRARDLKRYGLAPDLTSEEEEDEFADRYADERADIEKTKQSIDKLIEGLRSLEPTTLQELAVIRERLKVLTAAKGDAQILRNICSLTVQAKVKRLGLYLDQTLSGTNPKANPLTRWFDLQIADFFIYNDAITDSRVGILRPEGDMVPLDHEDLRYSRYWQNFSDHFPVGGIYGVGKQGIPFELGRHGQYTEEAVEQARLSNLRRFAYQSLVDQGQASRVDTLTERQMAPLALRKLRAKIRRIDPQARIPNNVEDCLALIQRLETENPRIAAKHGRLLVTEPTDFEPDYGAGRSPPTKRRRLRLDTADTDSHELPRTWSSQASSSHDDTPSPEASSSLDDTPSPRRRDTKGKRPASKGRGSRARQQVQPQASANRVSQGEIHAFLNEIAPNWNEAFANVPGNGAQQGLNQGYMAHQVAGGSRNVALPVHIDARDEQRRIARHGLRMSENGGQGALCFIYSVLMGLTGQSEREVRSMVAYVARRAGVMRGWINADSDGAANVVQEIDAIYGTQLDVVVVQHGVADAIISGRAGQLGGRTVLIRQTPGHYDACVPR